MKAIFGFIAALIAWAILSHVPGVPPVVIFGGTIFAGALVAAIA